MLSMVSSFCFYNTHRANTDSLSSLSSRRYDEFMFFFVEIANILVLCGLEPDISLERKSLGDMS